MLVGESPGPACKELNYKPESITAAPGDIKLRTPPRASLTLGSKCSPTETYIHLSFKKQTIFLLGQKFNQQPLLSKHMYRVTRPVYTQWHLVSSLASLYWYFIQANNNSTLTPYIAPLAMYTPVLTDHLSNSIPV